MIQLGGNLQWWAEPAERAHEPALRLINRIRERASEQERQKNYLLYASLYGNLPLVGFGINSYSRFSSSNRIALNVVGNAIDSLVSKISKSRPRASFQTLEGDYEAREKAEAMASSVAGIFHAKGFYETRPEVLLDTCVFGTGVYKTYLDPTTNDVAIDRTYPWELLIDEREALYAKPRTLVQRKYYDRHQVWETWVNQRDDLTNDRKRELTHAIEKAGADNDEGDFDYDEATDQIRVYELWHLPSHPKADDGRHMICLSGATLDFGDSEGHPFSFVRAMRQGQGFWGIGVAEKLAGIQAEINRIVRNIQKAMQLIAQPHWMVDHASQVATAHINNDMGTIIKYRGNAPQVYVPQAMTPETFNYLQYLVRSAYEFSGISQLSASGQKPAGLNAAVAMREYLDEQSERFVDFTRSDETACQAVAENVIACVRKAPKPYEVTAIEKTGLRKIRWSEVDLKTDYVIQVTPTSFLPSTQAGKLAFVQDLSAAQMLSPEDGLELLGWPDTDQWVKRRSSPRKAIERNISAMRRGVAVSPEPLDNHALALRLVNEAYHEARLDGLPEDRLEAFRTYLTTTQSFMSPPPPPPGSGAPDVMAPPPPSPEVAPIV